MNKLTLYLATAAAVMTLWSCSDDSKDEPAKGEGTAIRFAVDNGNTAESRTTYGEQNSDKSWPIYWAEGDQVTIFSPDTKNANEVTYKVSGVSASSARYTLTGNNTMQWSAADKHTFRTFYPASAGKFASDGSVTATLPQYQKQTISQADNSEGGITYTSCNMDYAFMTGRISVNRTEVSDDQPIVLPFKPAVTTLDIEMESSNDYAAIVSSIMIANPADVTVGRTPLTGTITYNVGEDGTIGTIDASKIAQPGYFVNIVFDKPITLRQSMHDKLKVSVFVLPVTLPDNLRIMVNVFDGNTSEVGPSAVCTKKLTKASTDIKPTAKVTVPLGTLPKKDFNYEMWMASVPNDCYLSQLSLPGTHDTAASDAYGSVANASQTQELSLADQLTAGVRVLDMRVKYRYQSGKGWNMAHGLDDFNLSCAEAFRQLYAWIAVHPTETFIIRFKNEGQRDNDFKQWQIDVASMIRQWIPAEYLVDTFDPEWTLGDVRGKILLISTDYYQNGWIGCKVSWGDNTKDATKSFLVGNNNNEDAGGTPVGSVRYSDYYEGTGLGAAARVDKDEMCGLIDTMFSSAASNTSPSMWHWTWLNVTGTLSTSGHPGKNDGAEVYNQYVATKLTNRQNYPIGQYKNCGMVMMDWVDYSNYNGGIAKQAIINNNFTGALQGVWPMRKSN